VEIEGGVAMSIRLRGKHFGVVRYHIDDDGGLRQSRTVDGSTRLAGQRRKWSRCYGGRGRAGDRWEGDLC